MITPLLAASFDAGPYISVVKVGVVVVMLLVWAAVAQWVDRDTIVVKTRREQWNTIVLSGACVATFVLFLVPMWHGSMFIVGVLSWMLLAGGAILAYVVHRNSRMVASAKVLTLGHFKRMLSRGDGRKRVKSKGLRVSLSDHNGDFVELPDDPDEAQAFQDVQDFLYDLLWRRASDADIVAGKEKYRLIYRIDGVSTEREEGIAPEIGERLVRFLKQTAGLKVEEIRRPQRGTIIAALLSEGGSPGKTEVYTSGTTAGERMRLKIKSDPRVMRLHELGLAAPRLAGIKKILGQSHGLFLVSAPEHQGLTTTQYAILRSHDAYMNNIHALERRPLTEVDNITQQVYEGANSDVNYARMLQTVLRREPDIVMVGECEDRETAQIAARAAADDRKIYLGLTAKDSLDALSKYVTLVGKNALVAKSLLGVVNQRLVRVLCTECREAFEPDAATLKKLNMSADKIECFYRPPSEPKVDRKGRVIPCAECQGTSYKGRTGIYELLIVDPTMKQLLADGAPIAKIKSQARKNRMFYLQEEGLLKVIDGTTSMNEILRCLKHGDK